MADERVVIEIELDDGTIKKGFATINKEGKKSGNKAGKSLEKGVEKGVKDGGKKGFGFLTKGLKAAAGLAVVGIGAAFASSKFINAAKIQEDAINALNSALFATGQFTNKASLDFQNYASSLQQQTKFGDEAILKNAALIQSLGKLDSEGHKGATSAAQDLAAALSIDLSTASTLVGRAATGDVALFKRYGVTIEAGANKTETFANALRTLNENFGGAAARQVVTFSGATTQLSNTFGDLFEEIGFLITKSPEVITFVKVLEQSFTAAIDIIKANADDIRETIGNFINTFRNGFLIAVGAIKLFQRSFSNNSDLVAFGGILESINNVIRENFLPTLGLLKNLGVVVFASLKGGLQTLLVGFLKTVSGIDSILSSVGINSGFTDQLTVMTESASEVLTGFNKETEEGLKKLLSPETFEQEGQSFLDGYSNFLEEAKAVSLEEDTGESVFSQLLKPFSEENINEVLGNVKSLQGGLTENLGKISKTVTKTANKASFDLKTRLGGAIAAGVQNITQSLLSGENVFGNFAKFALQTFGDLAVQLGQFFIIQGIAVEALKSISGAAAIAAGVGLVALGSILKSVGGGGSSAVGGAAGGGGGFATPNDTIGGGSASQPEAEEEREAPAVIFQTTVQGDILDSSDTQKRLFNLFQKGAEEEGIELGQGTFAT